MGAALDLWSGFTDWIASRPEVEQNLIYVAIPIGLGFATWFATRLVQWSRRISKRGYNAWWTKRELAKPREHELGFHDHRGRLKKLWVRLSYLRVDVYGLLTKVTKATAGAKEKKESAPAEFWAALAATLEPTVKKLEAVSSEMGAVTTLMLSSFKVVCARSTQASLDALKLFTENDPSTLQWQMKEDAMAFLLMKITLNDLKGEKFELNRVCDRGQAALEAIVQSNIAIFGACEAVIDGAKLPHPELSPIWVRATRPGSYANGKRRAGDVFVIQSEQDFSSKWMERVEKPRATQ